MRFAPSGNTAVVAVHDTTTADDLYLVNLAAPNVTPIPLARSRFAEIEPLISPDGRWLAYRSNETGRFELTSATRGLGSASESLHRRRRCGGMRQRRGQRLIYYLENGTAVAATLSTAGSSLGVIRQDNVNVDGGGTLLDIESHTDRVLVAREPERRIVVVPNWIDELKKKLTPK